MTSADLISRRRFLRNAAGAGAGLGVFNALFDLRLVNNAMAAVNVSDYKALICLFLAGGNDGANMIIPAPADSRYAGYKSTRGPRLALWEDQAAATAATTGTTNPNIYYAAPLRTANTGASAYAVHNSMSIGQTGTAIHPSVRSLFDQGKLAFIANTGVLVEPLTRSQFQNGPASKRPPQLFSHNDQVSQWQTSLPDKISRTGWGGRTIDKMRLELARQGIPPGSISLSVSLAGSNTWEVGDVVNQFQVSTNGAVSFTNYTPLASRGGAAALAIARSELIDKILRDPANGGDTALAGQRSNLTLKDFKDVNERALYNGASLSTALTRLTAGQPDAALGTAVDAAFGIGGAITYANLSNLEQQMHTIARIIAERSYLGMRRQIFFCQIGGYDTHGDQPLGHSGLLATLSRAMGKFYAATDALSVADKCTTFTAADFGRTFKSNSLGTDHAWGNHHMIMGGAVRGGRLFGTYPTLVLGGPDDTDGGSSPTGRFIPTTSTDEYAATLSRWFGLGEAELDTVFPNLDRFATRDVGFMS